MKTTTTKNTPIHNTQLRQGDVWLEAITFRAEEFPKLKTVARENGLLILARGEATGHHHAISEKGASLRTAETPDGLVTLLEVRQAMAMLTHQEHATIQVAPGVYRVRIQREYSPEAIRNVMD